MVKPLVNAGVASMLKATLLMSVATPVNSKRLRATAPCTPIAATMVMPSSRNEKMASSGCADGQMKLKAMTLLAMVRIRTRLNVVIKPPVQIGAGAGLLVGNCTEDRCIGAVGRCGAAVAVV